MKLNFNEASRFDDDINAQVGKFVQLKADFEYYRDSEYRATVQTVLKGVEFIVRNPKVVGNRIQRTLLASPENTLKVVAFGFVVFKNMTAPLSDAERAAKDMVDAAKEKTTAFMTGLLNDDDLPKLTFDKANLHSFVVRTQQGAPIGKVLSNDLAIIRQYLLDNDLDSATAEIVDMADDANVGDEESYDWAHKAIRTAGLVQGQ
jgi:hypothetical protein